MDYPQNPNGSTNAIAGICNETGRLFGMTAAGRMFVAFGCIILTSLGGFLLRLGMDKIAL